MKILTKEETNLVFNILDSLANSPTMSWDGLGNFEGLTVEDMFNDILAPLLWKLSK